MKNYIAKLVSHSNSRGGVLVLVALLLFLFIGIAALAIDIGQLSTSRNELQNAADAAALGATRQLGELYRTMDPSAIPSYDINSSNEWTGDDADGVNKDILTIINSAQKIAFQNKSTKQNIVVASDKIELGVWAPGNPGSDGTPFTSIAEDTSITRPTAVRVTAERSGNNKIATFFSGVFGPDSFPVGARATAALTGKSTASEGELELPIGISRSWFDGPPSTWCGQVVKFSPSTDPAACAGWTSFKYEPANDIKLRNILLPEGDASHLESPYNEVNDDFEFINGDLSEGTFENLLLEHMREGEAVDSQYDPSNPFATIPDPITSEDQKVPLCIDGSDTDEDGNNAEVIPCDPLLLIDGTQTQLQYPPCSGASGNCSGPLRYAHEWNTTIIVYDSDDCTPSGSMPILGYANVTVFNVGYPSYKVVEARVECDIIDSDLSRGGGADFGTYGTIPGLVE